MPVALPWEHEPVMGTSPRQLSAMAAAVVTCAPLALLGAPVVAQVMAGVFGAAGMMAAAAADRRDALGRRWTTMPLTPSPSLMASNAARDLARVDRELAELASRRRVEVSGFARGGVYGDRDDQRRVSSPRPGWQVEREMCEGQRFARVRHNGQLVGGGRNLDHLTDDEIVQQVVDKSVGDPAAKVVAGMAWAHDRYGDARINPSLIAEHKIADGAFDTVDICAWSTGHVVRRESTGR